MLPQAVSVLPDHQIRDLCLAGMVKPFDPALLNPASLDVRLGDELLIEVEEDEHYRAVNISDCTPQKPFYLSPNEFVLTHTLEKFFIPDCVAAQFALKSSLARSGFEHLLAGWIDPGFNNSVLTLELKNARNYGYLPLWPGRKIGQVIFMGMASPPEKSYSITGRYNNDPSVSRSKGDE
jgi:dCTP deaminase